MIKSVKADNLVAYGFFYDEIAEKMKGFQLLITDDFRTITSNNSTPKLDEFIRLYPNPTTNELCIRQETSVHASSVEIYNNVSELKFPKLNLMNEACFDISELPTSLYNLKINYSKYYYVTKKFIKI